MERMKIILPNGEYFTVLASSFKLEDGCIILRDDRGIMVSIVPIGSSITRVSSILNKKAKNDWLWKQNLK